MKNFRLFPAVILFLQIACGDFSSLTPSSENAAIKCSVTAAGQQGAGQSYEVRCESKGETVNITSAKISLTARKKEGSRTVARSFGEVNPLAGQVTIAPGKPLILKGVVPKQGFGTMLNQPKIIFQANLHYGAKDIRSNMDYDQLKTEEASNRAKYEILATARL